MDGTSADRLSLAEAFLREVVYRARAGQAAASALAKLDGATTSLDSRKRFEERGRAGNYRSQ